MPSASAHRLAPAGDLAVLFAVSIATRTYVGVSDEARRGHFVGSAACWSTRSPAISWSRASAGALLAASPLSAGGAPRNLASMSRRSCRSASCTPAAWRRCGCLVQRHRRHALQLPADLRPAAIRVRQGSRDLSDADHRRAGAALSAAAHARPAAGDAARRPRRAAERFTVRKRGGSEVVVEMADIDWIEASGNYAILHVGGETFEIRSSLTRLEGELDPKRFVRVHKSHVVNIARVAEVTPWVSGDWRIRLQDGAEVNLSRRYRQRFEALAPVRS
jgi:hypothetical protein